MTETRRDFVKFALPRSIVLALAVEEALRVPIAVAAQTSPAHHELGFYFPETGHHLSGDFLQSWRRNRNGHIFGPPITEERYDNEGWRIQYFRNVRLEQNPDTGEVQLGALGKQLYGHLRHPDVGENALWEIRTFLEKYPVDFGELITPLRQSGNDASQYTERVGLVHYLDRFPGFYRFWQEQRNQHLRLLWPGEVELYPLGQIAAEYFEVDTVGVSRRSGSLEFSPNLFDREKRIDISLAEQILEAYEGSQLVLRSPVSTGKPEYRTPAGNFAVNLKREFLDYRSPFPEAPYFQPQVPFNLRFFGEAYIHGAYWHDQFGTSRNYGRSYGCVNLDMDEAWWLYNWTPMRTPVRVHY